MPASVVDALPGGGSRSLEVRWIRRGAVPQALVGRFGPFREPIERREDRYLVDPRAPDLGVKIRGSVQLDLKAYRGSPGRLRLPGGGGALELWEKWTFPLAATSPEAGAAGWVVLGKSRRRRAFELTGAGLVERKVSTTFEAGCAVELTEVDSGGGVWWTLAFEATGPPEMLEPSIMACAARLLDRPLPGGTVLTSRTSMSYARWLSQRSLLHASAVAPGSASRLPEAGVMTLPRS